MDGQLQMREAMPGGGGGADEATMCRSQEFAVLGSTGNLYDVIISRLPRCSCPDFARGNLCKHILFVYLKVLKVSPQSELIYQKALLSTEVAQVLDGAPPAARAVMASGEVVSAYNELTGRSPAPAPEGKPKPKGDGEEPTECPICFEDLPSGGDVRRCATCIGGVLHAACFARWSETQRKMGKVVTCPMCREPFASKASGASPKVQDGYLNFSDYSGQNASRDTSSYSEWYGQRRGRHGRRGRRGWGGYNQGWDGGPDEDN
mmetsp:Transcript_20267/g.61541  ORF Transcript_20267/g.61541 Transcript_20267/m.61541 type:complete len:262 (-) Transcript_20267:47-832(-)